MASPTSLQAGRQAHQERCQADLRLHRHRRPGRRFDQLHYFRPARRRPRAAAGDAMLRSAVEHRAFSDILDIISEEGTINNAAFPAGCKHGLHPGRPRDAARRG